jgi:hypothetical protein
LDWAPNYIKLFKTFLPSVRKTLFFQKKIKQLNVEFIEAIVKPQYPLMFELSKIDVLSFEFIFNTTYTSVGMDINVTWQANASKQLEIFFKEYDFFLSAVVRRLPLRFFLSTKSSL